MKYQYQIADNNLDLVEGKCEVEATNEFIQFSACKMHLTPAKEKLITLFRVVLTIILFLIFLFIFAAWLELPVIIDDLGNLNQAN
jgi:hypothetical protein